MKKDSIPKSLVEDIENGECVVFLGAGASTEGRTYFKKTLVDVLAELCNYPPASPRVLPKVASYFCDVLDGGYKGRLIREIHSYLDVYMQYGEAHNTATMAHDKIAKIGLFKIIVTTNWDVFMERELNVLPIVRDSDLVYWNDDERQVIKLHGCIGQPETMVVTEDDYNEFIENRMDSPICNKIKDLMATKTFLFLGYSLTDDSFHLIHDAVLRKMGRFSRCSYAILRDPTEEQIKALKEKGVIVINAYVIAFLRDLHRNFVEAGIFFADSFLSTVSEWTDNLLSAHFSTGQEDGIGFLSMMYQDGLLHSLKDLYYGIQKGNPKSYYKKRLEYFSDQLKKQKSYEKEDEFHAHIEIAYLTGRIEALKWALDGKKELELYFSLELKPVNKKEFLDLRESCKEID